MKIKRILFDLDGTLWDTQKFHAQAETVLMQEYGVTISVEELSARFAGRPTELVFQEVLGCDIKLAHELTLRKWAKIFPAADKATPLCDIRNLLGALKNKGVTYAIGTASPAEWARKLFSTQGLRDMISDDDIVGGDMVKNGKPAPDIWLAAAKNTPLANCLVVEDGIAGVEAAVTAGIPRALLLPRTHPKAISIRSPEDIVDML